MSGEYYYRLWPLAVAAMLVVTAQFLFLLPAQGQVLIDGLMDSKGPGAPTDLHLVARGVGQLTLSHVRDGIVETGQKTIHLGDFDAEIRVGDFWTGKNRVIASGQKNWRYLERKGDPPDGWNQPDFNDAKWKKGPAPLGFDVKGGTKIATKVSYGDDANNKHRAAYFRLRFHVKDPGSAAFWFMRTIAADGGVFYLNGKEVQRVRMPAGVVDSTTFSSVKRGGTSGIEGKLVTFEIEPKALKKGPNVLCVRVHRAEADSSALLLDVEMFGATQKEFAAAEKGQEAREKAEKEGRRKAAAQGVKLVAKVARPIGQPRTMQIFDDRMRAEHTKIRHLVRSLIGTIGISDDQAAELILCSDNALKRLRDDVERRTRGGRVKQNTITSEIYQGKIAIRKEKGFIEEFAAILDPDQLKKYAEFVKVTRERQLDAMVDMFLSSLDNGLFMDAPQREKMRGLMKMVAVDPAFKRTSYSINPLNNYHQMQTGFSKLASTKDKRLMEILNNDQVEVLEVGMRTIYADGFVQVEEVLVPVE